MPLYDDGEVDIAIPQEGVQDRPIETGSTQPLHNRPSQPVREWTGRALRLRFALRSPPS